MNFRKLYWIQFSLCMMNFVLFITTHGTINLIATCVCGFFAFDALRRVKNENQ